MNNNLFSWLIIRIVVSGDEEQGREIKKQQTLLAVFAEDRPRTAVVDGGGQTEDKNDDQDQTPVKDHDSIVANGRIQQEVSFKFRNWFKIGFCFHLFLFMHCVRVCVFYAVAAWQISLQNLLYINFWVSFSILCNSMC